MNRNAAVDNRGNQERIIKRWWIIAAGQTNRSSNRRDGGSWWLTFKTGRSRVTTLGAFARRRMALSREGWALSNARVPAAIA
jgi:hypothetical protein